MPPMILLGEHHSAVSRRPHTRRCFYETFTRFMASSSSPCPLLVSQSSGKSSQTHFHKTNVARTCRCNAQQCHKRSPCTFLAAPVAFSIFCLLEFHLHFILTSGHTFMHCSHFVLHHQPQQHHTKLAPGAAALPSSAQHAQQQN